MGMTTTSIAHSNGSEPGVGSALRFEDIESSFGEEGRMPAAQAVALIAIPVGTPLSDARATLERAGARCNMQRLHPSIMECIYAQRVTVDDYYPADIIWTTRLHGDGVRVTGMTVSRAFDKH